MKYFLFVVAIALSLAVQSCDTIQAAQYKTHKFDVDDNITVVVADRSLEKDGYYVYDLSIWENGLKKLCSSSGVDGFVKQDPATLAKNFYAQYKDRGCK